MAHWKKRAEQGFADLARLISSHPRWALALALVVIFGLASQLPTMQVDNDLTSFMPQGSTAKADYDATHDQFGNAEVVMVGIQTDDIFDIAFLTKLKQFHDHLEEELPWLDKINSLVSARLTESRGDELVVDDLMASVPANAEELARFKSTVTGNPFYRDLLFSDDHTMTTLAIFPLTYDVSESSTEDLLLGGDWGDDLGLGLEEMTGDENAAAPDFLPEEKFNELVQVTRAIASEYNGDDFRLFLAGSPVVTEQMKGLLQSELPRFIGMTLLGIMVLLILMFRRASGVSLPLMTVVFALLGTMGTLAATGTPMSLPMLLMPTFILAVGIGDAVHMLAIFFQHYNQGMTKPEALGQAMRHTGLPIALTTLTTAAGLLSFAGAEVMPIANLGKFSALGVVIAFFLSVLFLPAMISLLPLKRSASKAGKPQRDRILPILEGCARIGTQFPKRIAALGLSLVAVGLLFASQLNFSHNPMTWFPEGSPVREATLAVDDKLGGSISVEIVLDTGKPDGLKDPRLLQTVEQLMVELGNYQSEHFEVGKVTGLTDVVKETHKALSDGDPQAYRIPDNTQLLAQELVLFENAGPDELENMVDTPFSKTRITMMVPWIDALLYGDLNVDVQNHFEQALGESVDVVVTGMLPVMGASLDSLIVTMAESYLIALGVIAVMMMLLLGSVRYGLLSMVPNLTAIITIMGMMHLAGIPLDMFTMMVASIAIGVAVDNTVHFMHHFRDNYQVNGSVDAAVHATLTTTGRALLITGLVLTGGFFIFTFSEVKNIYNFGLLAGSSILLAVIANFLMLPALLTLSHGKKTTATAQGVAHAH